MSLCPRNLVSESINATPPEPEKVSSQKKPEKVSGTVLLLSSKVRYDPEARQGNDKTVPDTFSPSFSPSADLGRSETSSEVFVMNEDDALAFLKNNQPLPDDDRLTDEVIQRFDEVLQFFLQHKNVASLPLFLNAFGNGSGFGVYQLVEDVVQLFPPETVVPQLAASLDSSHRGVRYWCTQIAAYFPSSELIDPLTRRLHEDDSDIRWAAITALEPIDHDSVISLLQNALEQEEDEDLREMLGELIEERNTGDAGGTDDFPD